MNLSNRQRKKARKEKMCTGKRTFKTAGEASKESDLRVYRCRICYNWHRTSSLDMNKIAETMNEYI